MRLLVGAVQATRKSGEARPSLKNRRTKWRSCALALATALANAIDYHDASQTLIDDLTRLYNVRYLYQIEGEIRRARRYGSAVSVVFMDLTVQAGERRLRTPCRERDTDRGCPGDYPVGSGFRLCARYGGDEFVLMLPETSAKRALQMAERVRLRIAAHRFKGGVGADIYLTASSVLRVSPNMRPRGYRAGRRGDVRSQAAGQEQRTGRT